MSRRRLGERAGVRMAVSVIECLNCGLSYPSDRKICPGCWLTRPQQAMNAEIKRTERLLREIHMPSNAQTVGDLQGVPRGQQKKDLDKPAGDLTALKDDRPLDKLYDPRVSDRIPSRADNEKIMAKIKQQDEARAEEKARMKDKIFEDNVGNEAYFMIHNEAFKQKRSRAP